MEQVVIKSEIQSSDEILLFYVDENGGNEEGIVTTIDNMEQVTDANIQQIYIEENAEEVANEELLQEDDIDDGSGEKWAQFESKRLLVFYIDNKDTFMSGSTKEKFMWSVACKTMLIGKTPETCEIKLRSLKERYAKAMIDQQNGIPSSWYLFEMAHQAFHDDPGLGLIINTIQLRESIQATLQDSQPVTMVPTSSNHQLITNNVPESYQISVPVRSNADDKVILMLQLYIKHKNSLKNVQKDWQKGVWEAIALEMGELDADYWHKRFMNFKNNYVRLLDKRKENGAESINWPYMSLFDQIFHDDPVFQKRYQPTMDTKREVVPITRDPNEWSVMEMTILAKYCFDSFSEFQDPTIPNNFLWNEIGRIIDKNAELCKSKYEELRNAHLEKYLACGYNLSNRVPMEIIFDSLISKKTNLDMAKIIEKTHGRVEVWDTTESDELAQFFYDNIEMFKDPICYYVCWAAIAKKLKRTLQSCHKQWQELTTLYKTILEDKKENPDMQIDWRYIELFDRLFDYGMDEKLLEGYEMVKAREQREALRNVKKESSKDEDMMEYDHNGTDDEDYDGRRSSKRSIGSSKAFKILEFYQKNKDKFKTSRKQALWDVLGKRIGMNATQCAHRFRNLKQVYTGYVQREINKPEMPIVWPYYQLCKKVFGYRALKNKLRNSKQDSDDVEEWSPKLIKQLIIYFSKNFSEINDAQDTSVWSELAADIGISENSCRDKFLELRKSYRKLKTMKTRNPAVNVTWKYFNMFDAIYNTTANGVKMETLEDYEMLEVDEDISQGIQEDDDIQCIFVIPEEGNPDLNNTYESQQNEVTTITETQNNPEPNAQSKPVIKWSKKTKKRMLILYLNYLRSNKGKEINAKKMWKEIAEKLPNKTPLSCKNMFAKLSKNRLNTPDDEVKKQSPFNTVLEKILDLKPKFKKVTRNGDVKNIDKVYKDVAMSPEKVQNALEHYLKNIEEFISPRFEKKYAWSDLAKAVCEPVNKVYNKINYLKTCFSKNETTPHSELLKQISEKESSIQPEETVPLKDTDETVAWSDDEKEQLLIWYLANLEKFKNPKYVRKYLWLESSNILAKSALACSKMMSEIRTQYRNMVREMPNELNTWRFYDLCQKIYGTGKQKVIS